MGCPEKQAQTAARNLVAADLRGVDSHGVARLSGYVRLWKQKRINPQPNFQWVRETPSTAVMDADAGLGLVAATVAMEKATELAEKAGTGWVAVKNSNHFGIAGQHAMQSLPKEMIGLAMTNASPLVAPTFSAERLLGTNPIAVAVPAGEEEPYVADFATTVVANGKLEIQRRKGEPIPEGWAQDAEGAKSTSADAVKNGGALLPLGGERSHGSHKGYCLGSMVDIFTGVFSGANFGPWVPPFVAFLQPPPNPVGKGMGHFFGAMRIDAWQEKAEFKARMDQWIRRFRQSRPAQGQEEVLVPGMPESRTERRREKQGIPLLRPVVADLRSLAREFGLTFP